MYALGLLVDKKSTSWLGVFLVLIWHCVICHGFLSGGLIYIGDSCIFLQN